MICGLASRTSCNQIKVFASSGDEMAQIKLPVQTVHVSSYTDLIYCSKIVFGLTQLEMKHSTSLRNA